MDTHLRHLVSPERYNESQVVLRMKNIHKTGNSSKGERATINVENNPDIVLACADRLFCSIERQCRCTTTRDTEPKHHVINVLSCSTAQNAIKRSALRNSHRSARLLHDGGISRKHSHP